MDLCFVILDSLSVPSHYFISAKRFIKKHCVCAVAIVVEIPLHALLIPPNAYSKIYILKGRCIFFLTELISVARVAA